MKGRRHVNVFQKPDGKCVHDKSWDDGSSSKHAAHQLKTTPIAPLTLFPLIQVFVQFSREVQGGSVRRLVFRNPDEYAPVVKSFRPTPHRNVSDDKPPLVIHIADNDSFIVTVTETIPTSSRFTNFLNVECERAPAMTIIEFCESCLDFLSKEQAAYRSTITDTNFANSQDLQDLSCTPDGSSMQGPPTLESQSHTSGSYEAESIEPVPEPSFRDPTVSIDEARLSEYISKTQRLLRM